MASIINVDQIRNAAGTSAMTIDSSGQVLSPQVPYFYLRGYAGRSSTAIDSSDCPVYFDSIEESRGGGVTNSSTDGAKYTVPVAGVYCIWVNVGYKSSTNFLGLGLYHNTTLKQYCWSANNLRDYPHHLQIIMNLAQNDIIRTTIHSSYGTPDTGSKYMNFCGYLIG